MIPIYWRYLLTHYFKVFFLTSGGFVALLLTARLDEIAHFASLGPHLSFLLSFIFYQVPYILPIAIPIASLIAAWNVTQTLTQHRETIAFRALGFSPFQIILPIILLTCFLSLFNFYCISELSTHSHFKTQHLKHKLRSINPLLLLHHKHLMRLRGISFETFGPSKMGEYAQDAILAMPDNRHHRMNVMIAKKLEANDDTLEGKQLTFLSTHKSGKHLFVENLSQTHSPLLGYPPFLQGKTWKVTDDQLQFSLLLARLKEEQHPSRIYSEITRRISLSLSVLTLSLLGLSFGLSLNRSRIQFSIVILLVAIFLVCIFTAKGNTSFSRNLFLFTLPHIALITVSALKLISLNRGREICV